MSSTVRLPRERCPSSGRNSPNRCTYRGRRTGEPPSAYTPPSGSSGRARLHESRGGGRTGVCAVPCWCCTDVTGSSRIRAGSASRRVRRLTASGAASQSRGSRTWPGRARTPPGREREGRMHGSLVQESVHAPQHTTNCLTCCEGEIQRPPGEARTPAYEPALPYLHPVEGAHVLSTAGLLDGPPNPFGYVQVPPKWQKRLRWLLTGSRRQCSGTHHT